MNSSGEKQSLFMEAYVEHVHVVARRNEILTTGNGHANKTQMLKLSQRTALNGLASLDKRLVSSQKQHEREEDRRNGGIKLKPGEEEIERLPSSSQPQPQPQPHDEASRVGQQFQFAPNPGMIIDEASTRLSFDSTPAAQSSARRVERRRGSGKDGHRNNTLTIRHRGSEDLLCSTITGVHPNQVHQIISQENRRSSAGDFLDSPYFARRLVRRLSLRKSRRLSTRMATDASTSADAKDGHHESVPSNFLRTDSIIIRVEPGHCFSEYSNVVVEPPARCDPRLGTLGELRHHLRTGTKEQVKRFLRQNNWTSGHRIRAELWKELCHDNNSDAQRAVYRDIVQKLGTIQTQPAYLASPSVVLCDHQLKETGRNCLLRLLTAVEHQRPDFTYVPVLYPLGALFLHYMNEEEAFACIMNLISQSQKFLIQTDIATAASKRTMLYLVKKHVNGAYVLFKRLSNLQEDKDLISIFDEWKCWIFRDLPFSHLVRVVDCFLFEGQKVLFRVALAIVHLWSRDRSKDMRQGKQWTTRDIGNDIAEYCKAINVQPPKLLKTAFGIRNLKMSVVRRLQQKYEMNLRQTNSGLAEVNSKEKDKLTIQPYHYIDVKLDSNILDNNQAMQLISWIPSRYQLHKPSRLFSTDEDGTSFTRLWTKLDSYYPTIVLIRTSYGEVFGAYCSTAWDSWKRQSGTAYFGTGETFLFRFPPGALEGEKFAWVGTKKSPVGHSEELFQSADATTLVIGGGSDEALSIRQSLECGCSGHSQTFDNPMLSSKRDFEIQSLEVFGFISEQ